MLIRLLYVDSIVVCCEIRGNTSPEYRSWYHFINDFYRLPFYNVVSIPPHLWIVDVPSLEINIYVIVRDGLWRRFYFICLVGGLDWCRRRRRRRMRDCGCPFPFWKNKFFWFDDNFRNVAKL